MRQFISKIWKVSRRDGLVSAIRNFFWTLRESRTVDAIIRDRRKQLSLLLYQEFNGIVRYGPFSGMHISDDSWWAVRDFGAMLLGIYEKEVLDHLSNMPETHSVFIDIGAADGYYAMGLLRSGRYCKAICYEASEKGRLAIAKNAAMNQVADKVEIHGAADNSFCLELLGTSIDLSTCVLLCDIEGGEFEIFRSEVLSSFQGSYLIIETHDRFFENGDELMSRLIGEASQYFKVSVLRTGSRDFSPYRETWHLTDTDRWLIASEGRSYMMSWLLLSPKRKVHF